MEHVTPAGLCLILLFVGPVLFFIARARTGAKVYIRRIAGIDAIDEAIGRSVELGRPIVFTSGLIGIGPLLYAALGVLRYIARKCAVFRSQIFVPCYDPEVMVLSDMAVQNAYRSERRFSQYNPASVRYLSSDQFAFASGYMGLVHRERAGSAFLFGAFAAESLILAEAGQQVGAMQVAATTSNEQIPFFITSCDYTVIGEEIYAAGAYLSGDPVQSGSLRGQDFAKLVLVVIIALGIVQATWLSIKPESVGEPERSSEEAQVPLKQWINLSWPDLAGTRR